VTDTEDCDACTDLLEATGLGISQPTEKDGKHVDHHGERLSDCVGLDGSETKSTSGLLGTSWRSAPAITTSWQRTIHVIADELFDAVERCSLGEFDGANQVCYDRHGTWNATQGLQLLKSRLAFIVAVQERLIVGGVGVLERLLIVGYVALWRVSCGYKMMSVAWNRTDTKNSVPMAASVVKDEDLSVGWGCATALTSYKCLANVSTCL
jgi:hypothetical protein